MGDRVSISFVNGNDESVALFHHWGGTEFPAEARRYLKQRIKEGEMHSKEKISDPLNRGEPNTVMVDFVKWYGERHYKKGEVITSSLYFGKDEHDGDNSDNGHYKIDINPPALKKVFDEVEDDPLSF